MVLNRENGQFPVSQSFDGIVVQIYVGNFKAGGQRIRPDGVPVVLRRDVDPASGEIPDRVVAAPVSELELEGFRSQVP